VTARPSAFVWAIVALFVAAALAVIPTPFVVVAPGRAIDLRAGVTVGAFPPPRRGYFLTDVTVTRASVLLLAAGLLPGSSIRRRDEPRPPGENAAVYERRSDDAMADSQGTAAYVAERAAGYAVAPPRRTIFVAGFAPDAPAGGALRAGDVIERVGDRPVTRAEDLRAALRRVVPGAVVRVAYVRDGRPATAGVATRRGPRGPRFGVYVGRRATFAPLPVPIHYRIGDVGGASGGLMFALDIYAALRRGGRTALPAVAGTGTLSDDGSVGPIEGVRQKLIAARRAGARIFLVPRADYAEIADRTGIRIVAVSTFEQALRAIGG
jgi:PDZ domain-containing protein